jgi:hypothetical protein
LTIGLGASLQDAFAKGLEIFFQVYFQTGSVTEVGTTSIDAGGFAFEIGVKYVFESSVHPWIEAKLDILSGDDGTGATDDKVDAFLSYESVADLMILEDQYFGADWDTNLFAFKFSGGVALSTGTGKDNLRISGIIGLCKTDEDVTFGAVKEDALGTEFDVKVQYDYSKQVTLEAGGAFLFGSDILELSGGGSANPNADDSSMLFWFGIRGKF